MTVKRDTGFAIGAALVAALLLWSRRASASVPNQNFGLDITSMVFPPQEYVYGGDIVPGYEAPTDLDILGVGLPTFGDELRLYAMPQLQNLDAFRYMLRRSEHLQADVDSGMDYMTFYGGSYFANMADHPVITGEKKGYPLSAAMCRNAGLNPGCVSTAAGAYQLTRPTWSALREQAPRIERFDKAGQDEAARRLLNEIGALAMISAGNIGGAIKLASKRWASLPYSTAGQSKRSLDEVVAFFTEGGGVA